MELLQKVVSCLRRERKNFFVPLVPAGPIPCEETFWLDEMMLKQLYRKSVIANKRAEQTEEWQEFEKLNQEYTGESVDEYRTLMSAKEEAYGTQEQRDAKSARNLVSSYAYRHDMDCIDFYWYQQAVL